MGLKEIKQMHIFFNNATQFTNDFELLLLFDAFDSKKDETQQQLEFFGALDINNSKTDSVIEPYFKKLKQPLQ